MPGQEPSGWHRLGEVLYEVLDEAKSRNPFVGSGFVVLSEYECESPLEYSFGSTLSKYLHGENVLEPQVSVATITGTYRLDFVARRQGRQVAFECDGREFHDAGRDEWRDAMILGAEAVDVIYRFRGHDIFYNLEDCLFLVSAWEPELFSPRGVGHLKQLASDEARRYVDRTLPDQSSFHGWHPVNSSTNISIVRNSRHIPTGRSPFWVQLYNFAQNRGGGNLDTLMSQWV